MTQGKFVRTVAMNTRMSLSCKLAREKISLHRAKLIARKISFGVSSNWKSHPRDLHTFVCPQCERSLFSNIGGSNAFTY